MEVRKARVYKLDWFSVRGKPWNWKHACREVGEPGGYVGRSGVGYETHAEAVLLADWHVKTCRGRREFKERT